MLYIYEKCSADIEVSCNEAGKMQLKVYANEVGKIRNSTWFYMIMYIRYKILKSDVVVFPGYSKC